MNADRLKRQEEDLRKTQTQISALIIDIREYEQKRFTEMERIRRRYDDEIEKMKVKLQGLNRQLPDMMRTVQMSREEIQKEMMKSPANSSGAPGSQRRTGTTGFKY